MTLVPVVVALVCRIAIAGPTTRPFIPYDARISMAMKPDTVHPVLAPLVPFLALLATLAVAELWASPTAPHSRLASAACALHYALDAVLAATVTICVTGTCVITCVHQVQLSCRGRQAGCRQAPTRLSRPLPAAQRIQHHRHHSVWPNHQPAHMRQVCSIQTYQ